MKEICYDCKKEIEEDDLVTVTCWSGKKYYLHNNGKCKMPVEEFM